jgi:crossover junction endodeoxyribonuclease RuvC
VAPQKKSSVILGIDPGTIIMGYGLIAVNGNTISLMEMGVLHLSKYKDPYKRLLIIHNKVTELVRIHQPNSFAIEAPFFGKNVQSMLKLGRAQGVAIAAAMASGIEAVEYLPKSVKQSVTGNGNATKEQVWKMLQQILQFKESPEYLDATDALAVAVCHHYKSKSILGTASKLNGWADFIKANPDKVKMK